MAFIVNLTATLCLVCATTDVDAVKKITVGLPQKYPAEVYPLLSGDWPLSL